MKQLLTAIVLSAFAINVSAYSFYEDGIWYTITSNNEHTCEVTYHNRNYNSYSGEVNVPSKVVFNGMTYSVTRIGNHAFYGSFVNSVTMPENITSIGEYAFAHCSKLKNIKIPDSVTDIEDYAFEGCGNLPVENSIRYADSYLVETVNKTLTAYEIKPKTKWIGDCAFMDCVSLLEISIPEGVNSVGICAFLGCLSLKNVTIPKGVKRFGTDAFYNCTNLTDITIPEGVTNIGAYAFRGSGLTNLIIPSSVKEFGNGAFCESSLENVTISEGVVSIGDNVFMGCKNLSSINIPKSITMIGEGAFEGCDNLPVVNSIRYADTYLVKAVDEGLSSYKIENGTKWIGSSAFSNCQNLVSISMPESVTSIGEKAFFGCSSLVDVVIPKNVEQIGDYAFDGCDALPVENAIRYADSYLVKVVDTGLATYHIR